MSATRLRAVIKRLGLTQVGAAKELGVDPRTVLKWVGGERRIPAPVVLLLKVWLNYPHSRRSDR
jgi:transcriptional regulator with XRE-family HTH domain